uniref:Ig-like domain-containing protein n=1 Tax=Echeneis naucrates TaxID=173247 RepID=A0A665WVQ5_ECHNA
VTLKCEVEHSSAGWRFFWYQAVPDGSGSYSYELLPGSSNGTEQDSYIIHGQTHTAGYVCETGRGDPEFKTQKSQPKFVWSGDSNLSVSLAVSPDRVQHFTDQVFYLSCEGNSSKWSVRLFPQSLFQSSYIDWRAVGSTWSESLREPQDIVFYCESGSGELSNSVNLTVHDYDQYDIILVSPVHPVTEGESVLLGCISWREAKLSSVFFYHNDEVIQNDTRTELNISAVSKSDEGFYKCQSSGRMSAQSWMSVKAVPTPDSSSSLVLLIVRLVCGTMLIIVLLLCACSERL